MPSARFSHAAVADASINQAWTRLQVPETWEAIPGVDEVFDAEFASDDTLARFHFHSTAAGTSYEGVATANSSQPPTAMILAIDSSEVAGLVETELVEAGQDEVEIRVSVELESKGFLAGMFFPVVARIVEKGLPASVQDFADRLSA